ncbi:hypothetical protein H632_c4541p0 [Helicosporidium sp. ATCC 50920]|nr:hypothetical protein H632_c4541p0 [Helicosporidium sp. ATCC 50920]|eukprot:KDD71696.1 hypothetical protein H632_c4541p0 [Helicosporidium sp. ATCC 50920]
MFALFHRGCADVLPVGDLGVRKGMQMLYGLRELPDPKAMERVAEGWKPYRSAGAWYMWKAVEDEQQARAAAREAKAALAAEAKLARLEARAAAKALKEASPPKRRKKAGEEEA